MDLLHSLGVDVVVQLQTHLVRYEGWINMASAVADLRTLFFVFFPFWFHFRRETAIRLIWVSSIGDWVNMVLKWLLFGERPYWWVYESKFYPEGSVPALKQFPISCESGPGSPSGHAMASVEVWYITVLALLTMATERRCPRWLYRFLQLGLYLLLILVELWVCTSRVYIATHFPHQVAFGIVIGLMVVHVCSKIRRIHGASLKEYAVVVFLMIFVGFGFHSLLIAFGMDLRWTLPKAKRWCVNVEWVHLDSNPLASMMRNMGAMFGLGLGLHAGIIRPKKKTGTFFKIGSIIVSLLLLQLLDGWTFSAENHVLFYTLSFVKHMIALVISTILVPWVFMQIVGPKKSEKRL